MTKNNHFALASIFGIILFSIFSWAASVEVSVSENNNPVAGLKQQWSFLETEPGNSVLFFQILLDIPGGGTPKNVQGVGVFWKTTWAKPGKLLVALGSLESDVRVTLTDGSEKIFHVRLEMKENLVRDQDCEKAGIFIVPSKANTTKSYIGISCRVSSDRINVSVSVPQEAEADSSTIFETSGKGERWKVYEISRSNLKSSKNELARFIYNLKGTKLAYMLALIPKKNDSAASEKTPEPPPFLATAAGVGFSLLSASNGTASSSKPSLTLALQAQSQPLFWKLSMDGSFNYSAPLSKATNIELDLGLGPRFNSGKGRSYFSLVFDYVALSQDQEIESKSVSILHNQAGVRLGTGISMGEKNLLNFRIRSTGFGALTQDMSLGVGFTRSSKPNSFWAIEARLQSQKAKATTTDYTFGQTAIVYLQSL